MGERGTTTKQKRDEPGIKKANMYVIERKKEKVINNKKRKINVIKKKYQRDQRDVQIYTQHLKSRTKQFRERNLRN